MPADSTWSFSIAVAGVDTSQWRVVEFEVREAVFDGCRARLEVHVPSHVAAEAVAYNKASLTFELGGGAPRSFHGVVLSASSTAKPNEATRMQLVIGARLELLRLGKNSRIFQKQSLTDVVRKVLSTSSAGGDAGVWRTTMTYETHPYVAQYDESDYAFMSRLLFEEGIWFAVHNDAYEDQIVFLDDPASLEPIDGESVLWEINARAKIPGLDIEWVKDVADRRAVASDAVMLRDYDATHPSVDVSAKQKAPASTGREVYEHPGNFPSFQGGKDKIDVKIGARKVKRSLERLRARTRTMAGKSNCPRLEPGRVFTLEGHPRTVANGDHLILEVVHRGKRDLDAATDQHYTNEFVSIPKSVAYRPEAAAPAPNVGGIQWAFVTCPPNEDIHSDEHGRATVRFPWDRTNPTDDKSSAWLRVGQLPLGGSMIMPRKDFEVTVDFELGDFDRPFVSGHLYNALYKPPYALPGGATRSSIQTATTGGGAGANELRFEDSAGAEEIFVNASKDYSVLIDNDSSVDCVANETFKIGSNYELSVGSDLSMTVKGSRSLTVGATQEINVSGDYSDGVGGSESLTIGGLRHLKCGGDFNESIGGSLSRTVGSLQAVTGIAGYMRAVKASSKTTVGAAWCEIAGGDRSSVAGGARTETVGALKLVKAKAVSVSVGSVYTANVGAYSVKCGGGRNDGATGAISVAAGGGWSVKATNVTFSGENKIVLIAGGTTVTLSKSGEIKIKASGSIKLQGVEKLKQIKHDSGG